MPCRSRTGLARIDPLMDFGEISGHVHAIHGGGNFGFNTTNEDLVSSDCTSCEVTQDKSAYWTPSLHFIYANGSSVVVPQVGGMLAYYLLYTDPNDASGNITAFPDGFRMISGDSTLRNFSYPVPDPDKSSWAGTNMTTQSALAQHALGFNCLNYAATPEGSLYRHFLPDKSFMDAQCTDGLRLELMFPSCWNGKDLDSENHRSHVAFPDLVMTGTCPEDYPVKLPSLFYETIWNTYAFAGVDGEFALSYGDPTGYGYHGDFMMGWDSADFLQQAVNTCTNPSGLIQDCDLFNIQSDYTAGECTFEVPDILANDNPEGPREGLALSVPMQSGPAPATAYPVMTYGQSAPAAYSSAGAMPTTTSAKHTSTAVVPTLTYSPVSSATATGIYSQVLKLSVSAVSSSSSVVAATITTSAASLATGSVTVLSTSYITSATEVVELVIEQVVVTVTADVNVAATTVATETPDAVKFRRHLEEHSARRQSAKERRMAKG